jgi:Tol biopolymer transport system component
VEIRMPRRWLVPLLAALPLVLTACDSAGPSDDPPPPPPWDPFADAAVAWARDGDAKWDIYFNRGNDASTQRLTNHPGDDVGPAVHPNRLMVAFSSNRDGDHEILVYDVQGGTLSVLTDNSVSDMQPAWSRDGSKLAFVREVTPGHSQIFVMNADGSGQVNISNSTSNDIQPNWRPTADQLVFASDRDAKYGANTYLEVYRMNADGTGVTRLTFNDDGVDYYPKWSPDGVQIAFTTHRPGLNQCYNFALEVFVMNADGSGPVNASAHCRGDAGATWVNNGELIFMSDRDSEFNYRWDLYRGGIGGTPRRITTGGDEAGPDARPR